MAGYFSTLFTADKKLDTDQLIRKKTTWSFFFFVLFGCMAFAGWKWLRNQPSTAGKTSAPLRAVLNANEKIFDGLLSDKHLTKEYDRSLAANPARVNGDLGLKTPLDSNWTMQVVRAAGDTLHITLEELRRLPKTELVFNFKCIEGWSQITHWGGVRLSEFMLKYGLSNEMGKKYLGLSTPDQQYYVGIDMPSALHPQTLLCYELNGKPLPLNQGYPLRLVIPVKYGVKSLKRIGYMYFADQRPPDYWADKKGYDYFSGL